MQKEGLRMQPVRSVQRRADMQHYGLQAGFTKTCIQTTHLISRVEVFSIAIIGVVVLHVCSAKNLLCRSLQISRCHSRSGSHAAWFSDSRMMACLLEMVSKRNRSTETGPRPPYWTGQSTTRSRLRFSSSLCRPMMFTPLYSGWLSPPTASQPACSKFSG